MDILFALLLETIGVCLLASGIYAGSAWICMPFGWMPWDLVVSIKVGFVLYSCSCLINLLRKA